MHLRLPRTVAAALALLAASACPAFDSPHSAGNLSNAEWQLVRSRYSAYPTAQIDLWRPLTHPSSTVTSLPAGLGNPALLAVGYLDVTAAPFNADPSGATDATDALQHAFDVARDHRLVAYLPPGTYRVSRTLLLRQLVVRQDDNSLAVAGNDFFCAVQGATPPSGARARIVLADNAPGFDNPADPRVVVHFLNTSTPDNGNVSGKPAPDTAFSAHYNALWHSVDIDVGSGNPAAVGLAMRAAEGSTIQDVTILARDGTCGVWGIPASGGSTTRLRVVGGRVGVDTREFPSASGIGCQPSPCLFDLVLEDQREAGIAVQSRGATILAGFTIRCRPGVPAFLLARHWAGQPYDASLGLVDGSIAYPNPAGANNVIRQLSDSDDRSYFLRNVFIRHASTVDDLGAPPANPSGWRHFRELAVHRKPTPWNAPDWTERIHLDGAPLATDVLSDHADGATPPSDLHRRHTWDGRFPSIDDPGAILITAHGASFTAADNAPAIQAALDQAATTGATVVVPKGEFPVTSTITLPANARLVGIHPLLSEIHGIDKTSARFGGNTDPTGNPIPIVRTVDDAAATTVLGRIAVRAPNTAAQHSSADIGCYPILWRAGADSVFNLVHYSPFGATNYRLETVLRRSVSSGGIGLGQLPSPSVVEGLEFSADGVVANLIFEQLGGGTRLMAKTVKGGLSNLTFRRPDGSAFDLASLRLGNALFTDAPTHAVTLSGTRSDGSTVTLVHDFATDGQPNPRSAAITLSPGWTGLTSVTLTSPRPFGIADIATGSSTVTFSGVTVPASSISFFRNDKRRGYEHYPFAAIIHPQVLVTGNGGGRWFNFWHHGDIWAQDDYRHVVIAGTSQRLDIHHWHLQHIHSDAQAEIRDASRVSTYGMKHEHSNRFLDAIRSAHLRIIGSGGLSDAYPGEAHFRFIDCSDFLLSNPADEIHYRAKGTNLHTPDNPLVLWDPSAYDGVEEFRSGVRSAPATYERPILYRRGQPSLGDTAPGTDPLPAWLDAAGLPPSADLASDPTGAGIPLLLRFAFGLGPFESPRSLTLTTTSGLPVLSLGLDQLELAFVCRNDDAHLRYDVAASPDLSAWDTTAAAVTTTPLDAVWHRVTARVPHPTPTPLFLQVHVTR